MSDHARRSLASSVEGTTQGDFRATDWVQLALAALIFGSAFLWIALALRSIAPGTLAFSRTAFGAAALALIPASRCKIRQADWLRLVAAAILGMALPVFLFALAEERIPSALVGMLVSAIPIFTAAIAALETRSLPNKTRSAGLAAGFVGIVLMATPNVGAFDAEAAGVALVLIAVLGYAVASTLYAPLQQTYGSMRVALWLLIVATVALLPLGLAGIDETTLEATPFVALLILGVVGTGLVWALYLGVIGRVGAVRASVAGYLIPIVALVLGVVVLDEQIAWVQIAGVGVALVGGYILSRGRRAIPRPADDAGRQLDPANRLVTLDGSCTLQEVDLVATDAVADS